MIFQVIKLLKVNTNWKFLQCPSSNDGNFPIFTFHSVWFILLIALILIIQKYPMFVGNQVQTNSKIFFIDFKAKKFYWLVNLIRSLKIIFTVNKFFILLRHKIELLRGVIFNQFAIKFNKINLCFLNSCGMPYISNGSRLIKSYITQVRKSLLMIQMQWNWSIVQLIS